MANTFGQPTTLFSTTLDGGIGAGATTISVTDATGLTVNTYLTLNSVEIVYVSGISSNDLTVTRAQGGTTAVSHADGVTVSQEMTATLLEDLKANLESYTDTQFATKPNLVTAGASAGNAASNQGDDTVAARSDHQHEIFVGNSTRAATSTGDQAITGVGFTPSLIKVIAIANSSTAPGCYGISVGGATSTTTEQAIEAVGRDTGSEHHLVAGENDGTYLVLIQEEDGTDGILATLTSLDADGFTINWGTINHAVNFQYICWG